jgi:RNA methyltransferase, RsmE family
MHRFMVDPADISDRTVRIQGSDLKHLSQVLRLRRGDIIMVFDGYGMEYTARLAEIGKEMAVAVIEEVFETVAEPRIRLTLYQGLPKMEKMELIIQKAVELGVDRIVPVITQRTVVQLDGPSAEKGWQDGTGLPLRPQNSADVPLFPKFRCL